MCKLRFLQHFNNTIEKLLMFICSILLFFMIVIVFLQVIFRNVFSIPMMWTLEAAIYCFFWTVFLGAAVALRYKKHYTVELFPEEYVKTNLIFELISHFLVIIMIYVFVVHGYKFAEMGFKRTGVAIPFKQAYLYMSLPISGLAMFLFSIELIIADTKKMLNLPKGGGE